MSRKVLLNFRRSEDSYRARSLFEGLQRRLGDDRLVMDQTLAQCDDEWMAATDARVADSLVVLALISRAWHGARDEKGEPRLLKRDDPVRYEIATALRHGVHIIPVLLDEATTPEAAELPLDMRRLLTEARPAMHLRLTSFDEDTAQLADAIRKLEPTTRALTPGVSRAKALAGLAAGVLAGLAVGATAGPMLQRHWGGQVADAGLTTSAPGDWQRHEAELQKKLQLAQEAAGTAEAKARRAEAESSAARAREVKARSDAEAAAAQTGEARARLKAAEDKLAAMPDRPQVPIADAVVGAPQDAIRLLQQHLHGLGYYAGAFDGVAGDQFWSAMRRAFVDEGSADGTASQDTDEFRNVLDEARKDKTAGWHALSRVITTLMHNRRPPPVDTAQRGDLGAFTINLRDREVRRYGSFPPTAEQTEMRLSFTGPVFSRFVVLDNGYSIEAVELCKRACEGADASERKIITRAGGEFERFGSKFTFLTDEGFIRKSASGQSFDDTLFMRLTHRKAMSKSIIMTFVYRDQ